jgi:hypothetical protein
MCLLVRAAFWDQHVGVKMSFDITKPMKINFRQNLRGLILCGDKKAVLQNVLSFNNLLKKAKDFSSSIRVGQLS